MYSTRKFYVLNYILCAITRYKNCKALSNLRGHGYDVTDVSRLIRN